MLITCLLGAVGFAQVTVMIEPQPVQENTSVVLNCDYVLPEGQELIELTWKKDGVGIYRLRRYQLFGLLINNFS